MLFFVNSNRFSDYADYMSQNVQIFTYFAAEVATLFSVTIAAAVKFCSVTMSVSELEGNF